MSARVVRFFAASWLLGLCGVVIAESEQTSWIVTTTANTEHISTTEDNGLGITTTTAVELLDGHTTVPDREYTTVSAESGYDPGTKLDLFNTTGTENYHDTTNNQILGPECSSANERCGLVVNTLYVRSDIRFRYARTQVYSKIGNPGNTSNQATFSVMLPETAFISKFFIEMDGKLYEAYVKKKADAEKVYQDALEAGQTAAHVGISARESDVFVVSVNVAARSKVSFNLTYEELLNRRLSVYHHAIALTPGQAVQDLNVDVYIKEIRNITLLNVTTSDDEKKLQPGDDDLLIEYLSPKSAHVHYAPSESDQQSYLNFRLQRLLVEYDVDRTANPGGDIMLMDGYFVHFFAPKDVLPQPKHVIFVLDTSGSMWGRKLQQLQNAMYSILDSMNKDDYFSLIRFGTNVQEWSSRSQDMVGLRPPIVTHEVNEINIAKAKLFIKTMEAAGGTNINGALIKALQLAAKEQYGTGPIDEDAEKRELEAEAHPQPMIIFLTDGIPTVGELLSSKILAQVRAVNTEIRAAIFSLAFGDGANYRLLKKLSLQNHAFARKIYEASDAALQLQSFYNEISSPLLANVSFTYLDNKVEKLSLTTNHFHSYYGGSEIVIAGHLSNYLSYEDLGAEVTAWSGGEYKEITYKPSYMSEIGPTGRKKQKSEGSLERLWAYLTVRQLLDQHLSGDDKEPSEQIPVAMLEEKDTQAENLSPKARALDLSLKYGFVTPLTSLVVVVPVNGSENEVSEMVKSPIGDNALDPSPELESVPLQNKIMSFKPTHFQPPALTVKPIATASTPLISTDNDASDVFQVTKYTLKDVSWLSDFLDPEGRLIVASNESSENGSMYLINKMPPKSQMAENAEDCITPGDEPGNCRVLSTCIQMDFLDDYPTFLKYFCPIGIYAGVCCPYHLINNSSVITTKNPILNP